MHYCTLICLVITQDSNAHNKIIAPPFFFSCYTQDIASQTNRTGVMKLQTGGLVGQRQGGGCVAIFLY